MNRDTILIVVAIVCLTLIACAVGPLITKAQCTADGMRYGYRADSIKELCQ